MSACMALIRPLWTQMRYRLDTVPSLCFCLLMCSGFALAEVEIPREIRTSTLLLEIGEAVGSLHHEFALNKIDEYYALSEASSVPPTLLLFEARAASGEGRYERALQALEAYLADVDPMQSEYFEARAFHLFLKEKAEAARAEFQSRRAAVAADLPKTLARLQDNMVEISGGRFRRGDSIGDGERFESPPQTVSVETFRIGKYAVTFAEYDSFALDTGRPLADDSGFGRDNRPVINVSWHDAQAFIAWLKEKTGGHYRLPSETEWEYACRAGASDDRYCGSSEIDIVAWHAGNSDGRTQPVGLKQPNAFGLHDMSGNAFEWTEDCWHPSYHGAPADGSPWMHDCAGDLRVVRGGSWYLRGWLRASFRLGVAADHRPGGALGFRLAESLPASTK